MVQVGDSRFAPLVSFRSPSSTSVGSEKLLTLRKSILATEQEDDFINLPKGVEWPQLGAVPLFVRHFYEGCYKGPLQSLTADKEAKLRKFVILGNAGSE